MKSQKRCRLLWMPSVFEWAVIGLVFLSVWFSTKEPWTDEFVGITFAAFSDFGEMWHHLYKSLALINHGQTGVYYLIQYFGLKLFGAHLWVVRWPSSMSYAGMLFCFASLLNIWRIPLLFRVVALVAFATSGANLDQAVNGRPYTPLAFAVILWLWVWTMRVAGQSTSRQFLNAALACFCFGVLFHPYFIMYFGLMSVVFVAIAPEYRAVLMEVWKSNERKRLFAYSLIAGSVFMGIGIFSWFRATRPHSFDPYQYIGRDKSVARIMMGHIFAPFGKPWGAAMAGTFGVALIQFFRKRKAFPYLREILCLFAVAVITQWLITRASIRSNYWILPRQWVAAIPLLFLMTVLFFYSVYREFFKKQFQSFQKWGSAVLVLFLYFSWVPSVLQGAFFRLPQLYTPEKLVEMLCDPPPEGSPKVESKDLFSGLLLNSFSVGGPIIPYTGCYYYLCDEERAKADTRKMFCETNSN